MRRLAVRAEIRVPALHAFRRTFATEFLRSGGTMLDRQKLLGHSTLHLIQRYATRNTDDLQATINVRSPDDKV
jgi:integrase